MALLTELFAQHAPLYLLAAGIIVCVSGYAGFQALALANNAARVDRSIWVATAGLSFGVGAWSTHFVAMMGYRPDAALAFRVDLTVGSLAVALIGVGATLAWGATSGRRVAASVLGAASTLAMHAVGMAGLANCVVSFDAAASIVAFGGAAAAYWLALCVQAGNGGGRVLVAAGVFAAGLCWAHFVSLAGSEVTAIVAPSPAHLTRALLEPIVLLGAGLLMAGTVVTLYLQTRSDRRQRMIAAVAASMTDGAALLDADGSVIWANPALRGMLGRDVRAESKTAPPLEWLEACDASQQCMAIREARRRDLLAAIRGGLAWRGDVEMSDAEGRRRTRDMAVSAVADPDGARLAMLLVLRDVTDDREREARLAAARDEAEALNRAKTQLLAVASHELRTPMNGMLGLSELLRASVTDPRGRTLLDALKQTVRRFDDVLADMLEYAQGPPHLAPDPCAPEKLRAAVEARHASVAAAKGLAFSVSVDPDLGEAIQCDRRVLLRALGRLVDNAIKFTPRGRVSVTLRRGGWNDRPAVVCDVRDNGPGIDEAVLQDALAGFAQLDASTTRAHGGLGLGLALTHRMVAAMRGVLTVSSDAQGSCFSIILPGATETGRDAAFYSRDIA